MSTFDEFEGEYLLCDGKVWGMAFKWDTKIYYCHKQAGSRTSKESRV